jgi:hypothetical protein
VPSTAVASHLQRRTIMGLIVLAVLLCGVPAASAATLQVASGGSDSGNCTASPCGSFKYAYGRAASGDVVQVGAGVLGPQEVPEGSKAVTFKGLPGNKLRQLDNSSDNVTFDGLDVDAGGVKTTGAVFEDHGNQHVTFRNGRIGNVVDEKGALLGGEESPESLHMVLDNVTFHDVIQKGDAVHNECLFTQTAGLTLRNSIFTNCATMDASINRGSWWGQQPYGGVTLENNVFGHSVNGSGWHYYGVMFSTGAFTNNRIVNNTFENAVYFSNIGSGWSGLWANNIGGGWDCLSGVTFKGNVGQKCATGDKPLSPQNSCFPPACNPGRTMPVGWVDPAAGDFHLKADSAAIGAADPAYAPATDRDGKVRGATPDAGAYQYRPGEPVRQGGGQLGGGAGGRNGAGAGGAGARKRPALRKAKLRAVVICKRARHGCPASTRVRVGTARAARVVIVLRRVRDGKARKHVVRRVRFAAKRSASPRIRAKSLRRGRYRLTVVAIGKGGRRSPVKVVSLRVR